MVEKKGFPNLRGSGLNLGGWLIIVMEFFLNHLDPISPQPYPGQFVCVAQSPQQWNH